MLNMALACSTVVCIRTDDSINPFSSTVLPFCDRLTDSDLVSISSMNTAMLQRRRIDGLTGYSLGTSL